MKSLREAGPFEGLAFRSESCVQRKPRRTPNRPIKRNETSDWKLTGMICLIEPVTLHEPAFAIRCFGFQLRPGNCLCDGMAKLRYPEYRRDCRYSSEHFH